MQHRPACGAATLHREADRVPRFAWVKWMHRHGAELPPSALRGRLRGVEYFERLRQRVKVAVQQIALLSGERRPVHVRQRRRKPAGHGAPSSNEGAGRGSGVAAVAAGETRSLTPLPPSSVRAPRGVRPVSHGVLVRTLEGGSGVG